MNMKMHTHGVRFALVCLLLIFGIAWASQAQADVTYSGRAFATFGGQAIAVDPFAPNQTFVIPNPIGGPPVATLIINEQKTSSGGGTQDITVNAVHLTLATGDEVILSSAHSDVKGCPGCPPKPP